MSSYFDKASFEVAALSWLSDDEFIAQARQIENRVAEDCLLCSGDREFPDDLRQKIVAEVAIHSLGYKDMEPVQKAVEYAKSVRGSRLINRLHDRFHEVATRRITTRFGMLHDDPANILRSRDLHLLETNPCPDCGKVTADCEDGKAYATCPCVEAGKRKRWTVDTIPVKA